MSNPSVRTASLMVLGAAGLLGALGTISTLAYGTGLSAPLFVAARAAVGAAVLGTLMATGRARRTQLRSVPTRQRVALGAAVASNATMNLALFMAFDAMTVALAMTLYYSYPVIVAVTMAARGRDPLTRVRVFALVVAMAGLALVVGVQFGPGTRASWAGIALALLAAACQAAYLMVSRDGYSSVPAEQATTYSLVGGTILSTLMALLVPGAFDIAAWSSHPGAWLAILVAGTLCAALPKVLLLRGVRRLGGTRTSVIMLAEPVFGVALAALVLRQALSVGEIIGGLAVLGVAAALQLDRTGAGEDPRSAATAPVDAGLPGV